ncbi:MAG: hypothetical protein CMM56_00360 [Rhodospirillaceae bacterium]|nr:hypothetical protein [Rhodospirillaceae bacterium]|tara:strand:+ start:430 stop:627 length:198 start_codon:yes stop_codon:yes gene_type:complete
MSKIQLVINLKLIKKFISLSNTLSTDTEFAITMSGRCSKISVPTLASNYDAYASKKITEEHFLTK